MNMRDANNLRPLIKYLCSERQVVFAINISRDDNEWLFLYTGKLFAKRVLVFSCKINKNIWICLVLPKMAPNGQNSNTVGVR